MAHPVKLSIELTLTVEADKAILVAAKVVPIEASANDGAAANVTPHPNPAWRGLPLDLLLELPHSLPTPTPSTSRRVSKLISQELARDKQRIGIFMIQRITDGMLADTTGALGRARAEQVFGMLELAEVLDLPPEMSRFLEQHHATILRGLH